MLYFGDVDLSQGISSQERATLCSFGKGILQGEKKTEREPIWGMHRVSIGY
jgi:hypothetical protein